MSTPRTSIIAGPARITFRGQTLFSPGDVIVSARVRAFMVASGNRPPQRREDQVNVEITFTPGGAWLPMRALLQPLANLVIGQDIVGAAGTPAVIDSADGWTYTYAYAALTSPPPVTFSAGAPLFGTMVLTAFGARRVAPTAAGRRVGVTATAYPADSDGHDFAAVVRQTYTLSWGSDPAWSNLTSADGISLAFHLSLTPRQNDAAGTIGLRLDDLAVTAHARPLGVPDAAVLAALKIQGPGAGRGRVLGGRGVPDLVVAGVGVRARLHSAGLDAGGSQFGATLHRVGELCWTASVTTTGADKPLRPLFSLDDAAPLISSP